VDDLLNPAFHASLMYFFANFFSGTTLNINTRYIRQSNPLTKNFIYYSGYTNAIVVESPNNTHFTSSLNFRQSLRFIPVDIRLRVSYSLRSSYNYIAGDKNNLVINTFSTDLALLTFTKGVLNGELGGNMNQFKNQSKLTNRSTSLLTLAPYAKVRANMGRGWTMVSSIQHFKYDANDTRRDLTNLSCSIVHIPPKSRFEFELNANNILNFNTTEKITSIYTGSFFEERIIQTLPGFLMAKVTFRL